jgi:hypothetical protein
MGTNSIESNKRRQMEKTHIPYNSLREYGYDFISKIIPKNKDF